MNATIDVEKLVRGLRMKADVLSARTQAFNEPQKYPTAEEKIAAVVFDHLADVIEGATET